MRSIKKSVKCFFILALSIIMLATFLLLYPYENRHMTTVEPIRFLGTYQLDDGTPPQPLTDDTYIDACINDSITLRGTFSRALEKDTQLLFFMEYMEVHIYLNSDEIYSWGTAGTYPAFMRSAGAAWGHCVLPAAVSPTEEITITLESKYKSNYNSAYHDFLDSLQTGDSGALARQVLTDNWPFLLTGLLLFLIGLTLQLLAFSLLRQGVGLHPSINYGICFILATSLWIVVNPKYSTLLFANAPLLMLLDTITVWMFTIFLYGYFGAFMQTKARKANDLLLFGLWSVVLLFLVLQLLGITDAYAVREYNNVVLIISAATFLLIARYELRHEKHSPMQGLMLPGLLYIIFGTIEVLNFEAEWLQRGAAVTVGFVIFIIAQFIISVGQIRHSLLMALKAAELEKKLVESHTAVMLSQIQPHFLYNSLLGIKLLCDTDPPRASEALEHFSFYLRGNLDSLVNTQLVSFEKELVHIKDYLFLEKMRFGDELDIRWDLQATDFMLPPLTVQPLIENAIRHGLNKKTGGGTLTIRSERTDKNVIITIQDDGVGFTPGQQPSDGHSHIGIGNTRSRLAALCGGSLQIESERGIGTTAKIILPQQEEIG